MFKGNAWEEGMMISNINSKYLAAVLLLACLLPCGIARAQTSAFTYQGRLTDGGTPANTTYQFQFKLFDALPDASGTQIGPSVTDLAAMVTNGVFTVRLDFGPAAFDGNARYLEIGVRPSGSANPYTILSPRQQITSSPYAIRSNSAAQADSATTAGNSAQLGGVAAAQYVVTTDSRLTDARSPTAGSSNYVQNTTSPQSSSNFNISGNGTAGGTLSASVVNAGAQYDIGGNPVLSATGPLVPLPGNLLVGVGAGTGNTGSNNTFVGFKTGAVNTGNNNTFFGSITGFNNSTGQQNAFFGAAEGSEFGKTTDQDGCIREGIARSFGVKNLDVKRDVHLKAFFDACLKSSCQSPEFCTDVPGSWTATLTDWEETQYQEADQENKAACLTVAEAEVGFCEK
jgi:hypothetical protein